MVLLLLLLLEDSANQKGKERKRGFLRSRAKVFMCKKRPERKQERNKRRSLGSLREEEESLEIGFMEENQEKSKV